MSDRTAGWSPLLWRVALGLVWVPVFFVGSIARMPVVLVCAAVLVVVGCVHEAVWQWGLRSYERRQGVRIPSVTLTRAGDVVRVRGASLRVFQIVMTLLSAFGFGVSSTSRLAIVVLALAGLVIVLVVPVRRWLDAH